MAFLLLLVPASCLVPSNPRNVINQQVNMDPAVANRRAFMQTGIVSIAAAFATGNVAPSPAFAAMPMVTTDEFSTLLKDSAQAVQVVEFSGPKSETIIVRLVDGTSFGIKDIVESSVDPRSPLKIAAICRENRVKTKFLVLAAALENAPKRKVLYTNERVLEAAEKEKAKAARIAKDEEARMAELFRMQEEAAAKAVVPAATLN
eukprot:CAMPEP_0198138462 /NCGR_PEP_ID=MMETSP1443-20131203/1878_1 /TAXON_ID=186043 /ORGANISM="Entomoneis sp., Strain CCMP2396" /LENGTH=203 /DNA_ID=CAMNT_0043800253 /DNA_START=112 /DNA_END=723 /DNA_ORIENTATION=-